MEIVLSIAGSDPSSGAGIQQDLKTLTAMGCYGATVITALTSQNTMGVQDVYAVPANVVSSQLESVLSDLSVAAVKIGQIPNIGVAEAIVAHLSRLQAQRDVPIVYDPVMVSTSGRRLMEASCVSYVSEHLFPLCTLVTPNIPEASSLSGRELQTVEDIDAAGLLLVNRHRTAFLLKGGHLEGSEMTDRLYLANGSIHAFATHKVDSKNLHGTGCTLSSAIAAGLAKKQPLTKTIESAKNAISHAILRGKDLHIGHGNGPVWVD